MENQSNISCEGHPYPNIEIIKSFFVNMRKTSSSKVQKPDKMQKERLTQDYVVSIFCNKS